MAGNDNNGSLDEALELLNEALSLLDLGSQHLAAAFVAQAVNLLETERTAS